MDQPQIKINRLHTAVQWVASVLTGAVEPYGDYYDRLHQRVASSAPLRYPCL